MPKKKLGFWAVWSMGVGGMIGGIFPVLGLAVQLTQQSAPIAFALAHPHSLGENSTSLCLYQKAAHSGWVS